jgi:hypothetical protein
VFTLVVEKPLSSNYLFKATLIETDQVSLGLKAADQVRDLMTDQVHQFQTD